MSGYAVRIAPSVYSQEVVLRALAHTYGMDEPLIEARTWRDDAQAPSAPSERRAPRTG